MQEKCIEACTVFSVVVSAAVIRHIVKAHEFLVLPPIFRILFFFSFCYCISCSRIEFCIVIVLRIFGAFPPGFSLNGKFCNGDNLLKEKLVL